MEDDSNAEDGPWDMAADAAHNRRVADFVSEEAPKGHPTFGGSPAFEAKSGQFGDHLHFKFSDCAFTIHDCLRRANALATGS